MKITLANSVLPVALAGALVVTANNVSAQTLVDLELTLLVDSSGSINDAEFDLQTQGYVDAFNDPSLFNNRIAFGDIGQIAVQYVQWSSGLPDSPSEFDVVVPWTLIDSVAASQGFADDIDNGGRSFDGRTGVADAINNAVPLFFNNDFIGTRLIIDISGDGEDNEGGDAAAARDNAEAQGITINALVIGGDPDVLNFYTNEVITNDGFVIEAEFDSEFAEQVAEKIGEEVRPTPVPAGLGFLALGLIGLGVVARRKA